MGFFCDSRLQKTDITIRICWDHQKTQPKVKLNGNVKNSIYIYIYIYIYIDPFDFLCEHFNFEKSSNNIFKMAGSGRQFIWTTVILYATKVTKEHAFHHPFSGLGDQHPLKASLHNSMVERTNSSHFI